MAGSFLFSARSRRNFQTLHPDLQKILNEAIKHIDFTITDGHRSQMEQERLFREGKTKIRQGGKHNAYPSLAADIAPYPISYEDTPFQRARFYHLQGVVRGIASMMRIKTRHGIDWDSDGEFTDQSFHDLPHVELVR